jgi:YbbR domain-containing protein
MPVLSWFGRNLASLLLAIVLALVVWVSAETSRDPNQENVFARPVPLEVRNLDSSFMIMESVPANVRVTLNAPRSVWTQLNSQEQPIEAWIDLAGRGPGRHDVPVQINVSLSPVRVVSRTPSEVRVVLEQSVSKELPVSLIIDGTPTIGYQAGQPESSPASVVVIGPQSIVSRIEEARVSLDISAAYQTIDTSLPVQLVDETGQVISAEGLTVRPDDIHVVQPITLLGGYRNVIVKPVYNGQLANGYKLTNISVTPPSVVIFSSDLQLLTELPGFIETEPLDLEGVQDDVEAFLELDLPEGVEAPNDQRVLVQVNVAAIESNLAITLQVDVTGLARGLTQQVSPETVDLILSGPVPVLDTLKPTDIRVFVDLTGRDIGIYQISPTVTSLPDRVQIESIVPETLEVIIQPTPTPTPTVTPTPAATPLPPNPR